VAHTCNPSYSGGRDQEDQGAKPAWANSSRKNPAQKRAGGVAQDVGPEFKPQHHKTKNKKTYPVKSCEGLCNFDSSLLVKIF
jgi:hypothetical protein